MWQNSPTGVSCGTLSVIPVREVSVMVLSVAYQSERYQSWYSEWHYSPTGVSSGTQSVIPVREVSVVVIRVAYQSNVYQYDAVR